MTELRISDIATYRKILREIRMVKSFKEILPVLRPVLALFGDPTEIESALSGIEELEKMVMETISIPDRFNELFVARGWIIYDQLQVDVIKDALEMAESGHIDKGEQILVNYYTPKTIWWNLEFMRAVEAFKPRITLAQSALKDYEEERYYASVLVVLSLLDGLVTELHERRRGFFVDGNDLTAWDSITAHSKGLEALATTMGIPRKTTRTEEILIPYRHGIMHGMDLGYGNKMVAAKCWAALFAIRDWAIKSERGLLKPPPEPAPLTWRDLVESAITTQERIQETIVDKGLYEEWKPREINLGVDIPSTGTPSDYVNGSPEQKLVEFLSYWKRGNYKGMGDCAYAPPKHYPPRSLPRTIKSKYAFQRLLGFEIAAIVDESAPVTEVQVLLTFEENSERKQNSVRYRLVNFDQDEIPVVRGSAKGTWTIVNW